MAETGKTLQAFLQLLHADGQLPELSFCIEDSLCILFNLDQDRCAYISPWIEEVTGNRESWYRGQRSRHFLQKVLHPDDFHSLYVAAILTPPMECIPCEQLPEAHGYDIMNFNVRIAHRRAYWVRLQGKLVRVFHKSEERPDYLMGCLPFEETNITPPELLYESLTPREKEILQLISNGNSSKIIADKLFISEETVVSHRKNLLHKFRVKNSVELVKIALLRRLID